ncbi:hypothetical protein [Clostridium saccharobutylicum]|uniref:Lipoprotein n=1 Tax=Clostridium saccharobutylicum TaxID=169679 RepID=A0A1S8N296_CLOSA|nr:hypothetical protein [Clostridium saccharobutylicum]OOM10520.1 hypothetical protein CLOSAC_31410 [Clostridium saccharobutylicum]
MKRRLFKILTFVMILGTSILTVGCSWTNSNKTGNNDNTSNNNKITEGTNKAGEAAKEGADSAKYTATNVKDDIVKAGHELKESPNSKKNYFKGTETDYTAGNDLVRVYEYDSADAIKSDIDTISKDGMTVNGVKTDFKSKPYYYKRGNTLIVYEGNDTEYVNNLESLYGKPLI